MAPVRALYLVIPILGILAIAYRYYSAFIAARVMCLDDARRTPAHVRPDGQNYHVTTRWVLFGHHFAAIAGAGPLIGPVLAAQFGYAPGLIWLVAGVCLAGAVHDMIILWASTRRGGCSLADIARREIGPVAGTTAAIAILFIVVIALAGLGLAVVNALEDSAWGTFTIGMSIPLALFMGWYMYRLRPGRVAEATIIGVRRPAPACRPRQADRLVVDRAPASSSRGPAGPVDGGLRIRRVGAAGVAAARAARLSQLLHEDRHDRVSRARRRHRQPGTEAPAFSRFISGGGPIVPGPVFPFVFITIACGAISGFHALIASGTTPKMIDRESDIRVIGYGAMLMEGLVGIMAIIAATAMHPGDYFAINTTPTVFATLGLSVTNLPALEAAVNETVAGRTGGAVSLAVGMAQIFAGIPGMRHLLDYWYHFAIMFEALFILTTIDAGTRVARFLVGEFLGRAYTPFARHDWLPGALISTFLVVASWAYFIWAGSISTIWPMFGIANQLLASVALAVGTTVIINAGRARYAWVTLMPLTFVAVTTLTAGVLSVRDNFYPMAIGIDAAKHVQGYLNSGLTVLMMVCVVVILASAVMRWVGVLSGRVTPALEPA